MIPGALKKQLPDAEKEGLVINRGFEKHLVIYTRKEWDKIVDDLSKLNSCHTRKKQENLSGISPAAHPSLLARTSSGRVLFSEGADGICRHQNRSGASLPVQ